jgi:ketosteroid isomerase-like protein
MTRRLVLVMMLLFSQIPAYAAQDAKAEQAIRSLDEQRIAALTQPDFAAMDRIMADDFTYTHTSGQTQTKAEFLGDFKAGTRVFKSLKESDVQVHVYGNAAVLTGRCDLIGMNAGKDFVLAMHFTEVYANINGHWQWIMWQSTKLPQ